MNTSVMKLQETTVVVSKFDNSDTAKAFTIDELEYYVSGIISNYGLEDDEEEALLALVQGLQATAENIGEGEVCSTSS